MNSITPVSHVARESSKRPRTKRLHWGLAALVLVCSGTASGQVFSPVGPFGPLRFGPDVAVAPSIMPATMSAYQPHSISYTVTNNGPPLAHGTTGSNTVNVHIDLTGFRTFHAEVVVPGGSCNYSNVNSATGYSTVDCTAPVAWGSNVSVTVYFDPVSTSNPTSATCTDTFHCGQPTYADAYVSSTGVDPNVANNRLLTRIDITGC